MELFNTDTRLLSQLETCQSKTNTSVLPLDGSCQIKKKKKNTMQFEVIAWQNVKKRLWSSIKMQHQDLLVNSAKDISFWSFMFIFQLGFFVRFFFNFYIWRRNHISVVQKWHITILDKIAFETRCSATKPLCLCVCDRLSIHQKTITPPSTASPLSRLVAKWQNADCSTVWSFFCF